MSKIRTAFPLEGLNYGLVSIHAVVNTGDMTQTINELQERVATHETVVDSIVIYSPLTAATEKSIENGSYKEGTFFDKTAFTTEVTEDGEVVWTQFNF